MPADQATGSGARIDGALSFARVPHWLAQADTLAAAGSLDLSAITRADSAGLALLLELTRRARARGQTLQLRNPPAQLVELSKFFELDTLLRFS